MTSGSVASGPAAPLSSLGLFLGLAIASITVLRLAHTLFPGDRWIALAGRTLCTTAVIAVLILGSRRLLQRDGLPAERLALGVSAWHARAFAIGAALAVGHIVLLLAALFVLAPFEISAGPLPAASVAIAGVGYLTGNFVEELVFRGYLLIVLAQRFGTAGAAWLLALPFGLFHFPGLDLIALGKMVLTTGAMHFVYAYAWIAARSLAAAVAMHAVGNVLLHEVVGTDKPAALSLQFSKPVDDGALFPVFLGISVLLAILLSQLPASRAGAAWLVGKQMP